MTQWTDLDWPIRNRLYKSMSLIGSFDPSLKLFHQQPILQKLYLISCQSTEISIGNDWWLWLITNPLKIRVRTVPKSNTDVLDPVNPSPCWFGQVRRGIYDQWYAIFDNILFISCCISWWKINIWNNFCQNQGSSRKKHPRFRPLVAIEGFNFYCSVTERKTQFLVTVVVLKKGFITWWSLVNPYK